MVVVVFCASASTPAPAAALGFERGRGECGGGASGANWRKAKTGKAGVVRGVGMRRSRVCGGGCRLRLLHHLVRVVGRMARRRVLRGRAWRLLVRTQMSASALMLESKEEKEGEEGGSEKSTSTRSEVMYTAALRTAHASRSEAERVRVVRLWGVCGRDGMGCAWGG